MSFDPNSNSILTDPQYLLENPGYIKMAHDALVRYGIIPTSGFGADAATAEEVNANPYSIAAMLKKGYGTAQSSNMNAANAHGALFSGAYQNNQLHSLDDYQHGLSDAGTSLQGELNTISGNRTNTLVDIWNRLSSKNTGVGANTEVVPGSVSIGGTAGNPAPGGSEADRPGIQTNPWHVPTATGVAQQIKKPKPVVGPQNVGLPGYR